MSKQSQLQNKEVDTQNALTLLDRGLQYMEGKTWLHIIILTTLPFFIYIKVAGFEFINMDDIAIIQNNYHILGSIKNIGIAFTTDAFLGTHGDYYRPIQTVSFFVDALIGKDNPWIYHVSELLYHLLTVIALYYLLIKFKVQRNSAFIFSLIFSLLPIFASAVSWIPARGDVLIGLWGILLMNSFINIIQNPKPIHYITHCALFIIAAFTKETALLFPLIFLLYFRIVQNNKDWKRILPCIIFWSISTFVFLSFRSKVVNGTPPDFIFGIAPLFNNLPTIPITIAKIFIPINLTTLPLFESTFTTIGIVLLTAFVIISIKKIKSKQWMVPFGLVWFLLLTIPPMLFKIYYSQYLVEYYEHRTYLPAIGIIITLAILFDEQLKTSVSKKIFMLPLVFLCLITPVASIHSDHYKNSMEFFGRAADLDNPGAITKRGELYLNNNDILNANTDFEKAIEVSNNEYPPAFYNRGLVYLRNAKDYKAAEADFNTTLLLDTLYIDAYIERANARTQLQNIAGALQDLETAKRIDPNNPLVYSTTGKTYVVAQQFPTSLQYFDKALQLDSNLADAYNDRAYVKYRMNKLDDAIKDCDKAININPYFLNAYYNKGIIYYEQNHPDSAIKWLDMTLSMANNFYFAYFYRGMAKIKMKDMNGACNDLQESIKLGFTMAQDTLKKYCK